MNSSTKLTPIVVFLFNRPHQAENLREALKSQENRELFVVVDGARQGKKDESKLVNKCISIFESWPSKVHFNVSERNLGCKVRVSSGLDWVFKQTDRAIILEDDLSPAPQFFRFCDDMLDKYENDTKVLSICGTKTYPKQVENQQYFFSKYSNCWGWATWARSWEMYDDKFTNYGDRLIFNKIRSFLGSSRAAIYWLFRLQQVRSGNKSSWAYCWSITGYLNECYHIIPNQNLIINQGFCADSTHTVEREDYVPVTYGNKLIFPIEKLVSVISNDKVDKWTEDTIFSKSLYNRIQWLFNKGTVNKILKGKRI
jgi:hypothetical protein